MISVRLTEEEYHTLRELCEAAGARSVSDLARESMLALVNGGRERSPNASNSALELKVKEMDRRLAALNQTVVKIGQVFGATARSGVGR